MGITPDNTVFIVLSFEGPDVYSMAGGLGSRITHLTNTLAGMGFQVHHIFIGDPNLQGAEPCRDGKLVLHRWCQWISERYPGGVYDGEEEKICDFAKSMPPFVVHELAIPAISEGKLVAILGEEWHTTESMWCISDLLYYSGKRDMAVMFWNANNTYGFDRIEWPRLAYTTRITTVSKYMKQIMLKMGIDTLVIPNGIPKAILNEVDKQKVSKLKGMIDADVTISKVARWHPDKGWGPAVRAIEILKRLRLRPVLLARGGAKAYDLKTCYRPNPVGLLFSDISLDGDPKECYERALSKEDFTAYYEAIHRAGSGDVLNFLFPMPYPFLQLIYKSSDLVLANSIHEPFGLVGLEAMAAGAVVFTGCSGEDYATHMHNAIVLDTSSAEEITFYVDYLRTHPEEKRSISKAARKTAEQWTWEEVVKRLICKLEYQAQAQGIVLQSEAVAVPAEKELGSDNG